MAGFAQVVNAPESRLHSYVTGVLFDEKLNCAVALGDGVRGPVRMLVSSTVVSMVKTTCVAAGDTLPAASRAVPLTECWP